MLSYMSVIIDSTRHKVYDSNHNFMKPKHVSIQDKPAVEIYNIRKFSAAIILPLALKILINGTDTAGQVKDRKLTRILSC
jgi:hypothetical protein